MSHEARSADPMWSGRGRREALRSRPTDATIERSLLGLIAARQARIGVIGLGYVGLPLACSFAEAGFPVIGFDTDPAKVKALAAGQSYIHHLPAARLAPLVAPLDAVLGPAPARLVA